MADRFELELITTFTEQGLDATVAKIRSQLQNITAPTLSLGGGAQAQTPANAAAQVRQLNETRLQAERAISQLQASGSLSPGAGGSAAQLRSQLTAQYTQLARDPAFLALQAQAAKTTSPPQLITSRQQVNAALQAQQARPTAAATEAGTAQADLVQQTVGLAKDYRELRAQVQTQLAADTDYVTATVALATARSQLRTAEIAQSGPNTAAFAAATQAGVAQRVLKAQQRKAEDLELDNQENLAILGEARTASRKLADDTKRLANQRAVEANNGSQILGGGTPGQRLSAFEKTRPGGGTVDPLQQQTFGQQFLQLGVRTAGYAISGTALYALADGLRSTVNETTKLDYQFGLLKQQTDALGQGSQFNEFRQQILGIARDTGVAGGEVANVAFQLEGAFHNTTIAVKDTRAAMELVRTTGLSIDEITNDLTAISVAYGKSFDQIGDKVTALQTRYGVLGAQSVQAFGIVSSAAQAAGLSFNQTAEIIGAVGRASGSSAQQIGNNLNKILPSIQDSASRIQQIYSSALQGGRVSQTDYDALLKDLSQGQTGQALFQILQDQQKLAPQERNQLIQALGGKYQSGTVAQLFQAAPQILQGANSNDAGALQQRFDALSRTLPQELSRLGEVGRQIGMNLLNSGLLDALKVLGAALLAAANATDNLLELFTRLNNDSGHVVTDVLALAAAIKLLQLAVNGVSGIGNLIGNVFVSNAGKIERAAEAQIALEGALNAKGFTSGITPIANAGKAGSAAQTAEEVAAGAGAAQLASEATRGAGELSLFGRALQSAEKILASFAVAGSAALGASALGRFAPEAGTLGAAAVGGAATLGVAAVGAGAIYYDVSRTQELQKQAEDQRKKIQDQLSLPGYSPTALAAIAANPANGRQQVAPFGINAFKNGLLGQADTFYKYSIVNTPTYAGEANKELAQRTQEYAQAADALNLFSGPQAAQLQKLVQQMQSGKGNKKGADQTRQLLGQLNAAQNQQIQDFLKTALDQAQSIQSEGQTNLTNIDDATTRFQLGQENFTQYLQDLNKEINALTTLAASNNPTDLKNLQQALQTRDQAIQQQQQALSQVTQAAQNASGASPLQTFQSLSDQLTGGVGGLNDLANQFPAQSGSRINISKLSQGQQTGLLNQLLQLQAAGKAALADAIQKGATPDQLAKIQSAFQLTPDEISALEALQQVLFGQITDTGEVATSAQELQQSRANQFAIAQANAQAQIAGLYNPAAINSVNAGLAQQQLTNAKADNNPVEIAQANATVAQVQRQQADTADQVAQSRLQLQQALDANNPVAAARDQVAAGNLALSQARGNVAAANAARAQIASGNNALLQANQAIAEAKVNLIKAQNPLDALKQAQADQQAADVAAKYAIGQAAQLQAQAQRLSADKAVQDALEAIAQSQYDVVIAQANAVGDTVKAAELNVEKAQQALSNARSRGAGTAELNALQVQVTQAQSQLNQSTIDTQEQIIQFQLNMLQITNAQAVAQLQQLLAQAQTPAQQRQIEEQIHQLQLTAGQDLQYNLPTTLGLPTLYTARRLTEGGSSALGLGAQYAAGGNVTNDNRTVTIVLNEATDGQQAVQTIVDALNSPPTTGTYPRLY